MKKNNSWKIVLNILIVISFVIYIAALLYFTIGKSAPVMMNGETRRANFVPFGTIRRYIKLLSSGGSSIAYLNLIGNIILFIPMAVYLPWFVKGLRKFWKDVLAALAIIILIEIVEYITGRGSLDVDDVILNLLGAIIGYGIWKIPFIKKLSGISIEIALNL